MNHRQTVQAVARRLPHLQQHQVAEVLEVTAEVWAEELAKPGSEITLINLGKLHIEIQHIRVGGVVRRRLQARHGAAAPTAIRRLYYRFRPSGWLRELVEESYET